MFIVDDPAAYRLNRQSFKPFSVTLNKIKKIEIFADSNYHRNEDVALVAFEENIFDSQAILPLAIQPAQKNKVIK